MITNNDKLILEAYSSVTTNYNKFQSFTESFWDLQKKQNAKINMICLKNKSSGM